MKIKVFLFEIVLFWFAVFCNQSNCEEKNDYAWPIDIRGDISGNFAESRLDHFHAGLDIATGGVKGNKLFAIEDGYLWRVRASVVGYGKSVYLKLNDGRYVVYAHMDKFIEPVEKYVRQQQKKSGKYEIDLSPEPGMFQFKKGDLVGYAGNSGDVAPHLHIELRNEKEEPINILSNGLVLPYRDTTYPLIKVLAVKPFDSKSMVDQDFKQQFYFPQRISPSKYVIPSPVSVWGKIGFKLNVLDTDQFKHVFKLNILSARLIIDGVEAYYIKFDRINYDSDYNNNFFLYDRELKYMSPRKIKGDFIRFFIEPDIKLTPFIKTPPAGYLLCGDPRYSGYQGFVSPGEHSVAIQVEDSSGNMAELSFKLNVIYPEVLEKKFVPAKKRPEGTFALSPELNYYDNFVSVVLNTFVPPKSEPEAVLSWENGILEPSKIIIRSSSTFEYIFEPQESLPANTKLVIRAVNPSGKKISQAKQVQFNYIPTSGGEYMSPDEKVLLRIDSNVTPLVVDTQPIHVDLTGMNKKLTKLSKIYEFRPKGFQLSNGAFIEIKIDDVSKVKGKMAIFEYIDNKWKLNYPLTSSRENIVVARVDHLSTFAVFADTDPPIVRFVYPKQSGDVVQINTDIVCKVDDLGVGLSYKKLDMKINGKSVPAEYNTETNRLVYKVDEPLNNGKNILEVTAEDRLGLVKSKSIKFIFKN